MAPYSGKSAVGAFFPGTITIEWIPDPDKVANELLVAAGRIEDRSAPLALSRQVAIADTRERFTTKTDPGGAPWKPWAPSYVPRARGSLMVLSGALMGAATSEGSYPITEDSLFISTAGWPDYWAAHQFGALRVASGGTDREEALAFFETVRGLTEQSGVEIEGGMTGTGVNPLPARPYIGPSFEAELRMIEIFDQWFGGIINTTFRGTGGGVQGRYRDPATGRFAKAPE